MTGLVGLPARRRRALWAITDTLAMTRRNLLRYVRLPQLLVFSTVQPVMFVLLFAFVFGGAIDVPGVSYIDFLMPGIFVQAVTFGAVQTGVGLADDLSKGMVDRFRSLPMARSAVLAGRTFADTVRNTFVLLLMTAVGYLIGFRIATGWLQALGALALVVGFGLAFSWISATIGMTVGDPESAQASSFVWIFPLVFASSAFVPVETMPGWLQWFAAISPVTMTVDALRGLLLGGPVMRPLLGSLAWSAGFLALFVPLAVYRYRRST
ncbi:MAG TPA: ABC transporter permease [Egibacteraceae bacterium]|nr:ABC transporter permease [Egibacteraceae bacterium]